MSVCEGLQGLCTHERGENEVTGKHVHSLGWPPSTRDIAWPKTDAKTDSDCHY